MGHSLGWLMMGMSSKRVVDSVGQAKGQEMSWAVPDRRQSHGLVSQLKGLGYSVLSSVHATKAAGWTLASELIGRVGRHPQVTEQLALGAQMNAQEAAVRAQTALSQAAKLGVTTSWSEVANLSGVASFAAHSVAHAVPPMMTAGAGALVLSRGGLGPGAAGALGAAAAWYPPMVGELLMRQGPKTDLGQALGYAVPMTALAALMPQAASVVTKSLVQTGLGAGKGGVLGWAVAGGGSAAGQTQLLHAASGAQDGYVGPEQRNEFNDAVTQGSFVAAALRTGLSALRALPAPSVLNARSAGNPAGSIVSARDGDVIDMRQSVSGQWVAAHEMQASSGVSPRAQASSADVYGLGPVLGHRSWSDKTRALGVTLNMPRPHGADEVAVGMAKPMVPRRDPQEILAHFFRRQRELQTMRQFDGIDDWTTAFIGRFDPRAHEISILFGPESTPSSLGRLSDALLAQVDEFAQQRMPLEKMTIHVPRESHLASSILLGESIERTDLGRSVDSLFDEGWQASVQDVDVGTTITLTRSNAHPRVLADVMTLDPDMRMSVAEAESRLLPRRAFRNMSVAPEIANSFSLGQRLSAGPQARSAPLRALVLGDLMLTQLPSVEASLYRGLNKLLDERRAVRALELAVLPGSELFDHLMTTPSYRSGDQLLQSIVMRSRLGAALSDLRAANAQLRLTGIVQSGVLMIRLDNADGSALNKRKLLAQGTQTDALNAWQQHGLGLHGVAKGPRSPAVERLSQVNSRMQAFERAVHRYPYTIGSGMGLTAGGIGSNGQARLVFDREPGTVPDDALVHWAVDALRHESAQHGVAVKEMTWLVRRGGAAYGALRDGASLDHRLNRSVQGFELSELRERFDGELLHVIFRPAADYAQAGWFDPSALANGIRKLRSDHAGVLRFGRGRVAIDVRSQRGVGSILSFHALGTGDAQVREPVALIESLRQTGLVKSPVVRVKVSLDHEHLPDSLKPYVDGRRPELMASHTAAKAVANVFRALPLGQSMEALGFNRVRMRGGPEGSSVVILTFFAAEKK
ncbi:MAG TPA: hypothetical protein PLQ67_01425 [Burkholderiaceae bacterium]|nr:hypothetical protein [Burkholderiaceae bacterium]